MFVCALVYIIVCIYVCIRFHVICLKYISIQSICRGYLGKMEGGFVNVGRVLRFEVKRKVGKGETNN